MKFIFLLKNIKPYGLNGLSIFDVFCSFSTAITHGSITTRASSLAFNFFLAFFPSVIVLFSLIPYIPIEGLQENLLDMIETILPPSTNTTAFTALEDIINNPRANLLSIGFILTIYFSTNGINALIEALNASCHIKENRTIIKQRFLSVLLTLILGFVLIITISLIIFGKGLVNYLYNYEIISAYYAKIILVSKWGVMSFMLFFGITIIFNIGPAIKEKFKLFSLGSIFSTIFIIATCIAFNYYINHFSQYNKIYGSIGTLIIILTWIYLNCIILLTGFELNTSILNAKKKNVISKQEL